MLVIHRDHPHNIRMAAVQDADELADRLAILQGHAVFAGDRQRLNNTGSGIFELALQIVITVHHKEGTQQQTNEYGRGEDQNHHARTQAVVGHGVPLWDN